MENNTSGNVNWNPSGTGIPNKDLPDAMASLVLGIVGLVLSICLGCGIVGFVLSIIGMAKGNKMVKLFESNPGEYSEQSYKNAKTGKVLGIIGFILGVIVIVIVTVFFGAAIIAAIIGDDH